jgi:hypothetical protein
MLWSCLCECGNTIIVKSRSLIHNSKESCGCYRKSRPKIIDTDSPIYRSFTHMKDRCLNPNSDAYENYGGRGITVCDRWLEPDGQGFLNFLEDMGERPEGMTLDRIDVNGNYEALNCRWVNWDTQCRNKRLNKSNVSGKTGVHWNKEKNKWHCQFRIKNKTIYLGLYDSLDDAITMRESVEKLYKEGFLTQNTSLSEIRQRLWGQYYVK